MTHPEPVTGRVTLKPGRDKPVQQRHPWIFSGAIAAIQGSPQPGDWVEVMDKDGRFLARGTYNPHSQITIRLYTWQQNQTIDTPFWQRRLTAAIDQRHALPMEPATTAYRLIFGEADGLPGLIVDKYGDYLVLQALTTAIDQRKHHIATLLADILQPQGILERSDADVRQKEGLPAASGLLWGSAPPANHTILENGLTFGVDLAGGHKTGFYLDQRDNRALVCQPAFVQGKSVLNVFAYTGGFGVYAAHNGATAIVNVDSAIPALEQAEANTVANLPAGSPPTVEYIAADAFELLRYYRDEGAQFDMVILDPAKFVHSQRDLERASRGYKDLNWLALRLLRRGGLLATFSCSGLVTADLFQKIVFGAAQDAGREAAILHRLAQAADHPTRLSFHESTYLKGLLLRVV